VLWVGGGQVAGQAVHVLIRLVLARLLVPDDFGLVAMAAVFISFSSQLVDLGLGPALVQRVELTDVHKSTAFWTSAVVGIALALLFVLGAPLVGDFYRSESVVPVVRALGLSFLLSVPESVYRHLFQRELSFRLIGTRRLVGVVTGGTVGIALALGGFGVWALVAEQLVRSAAGSVLYMARSPWRPQLTLSRVALSELWSYSRSIVGTRLVNFFNRNLDSLLIGRFLGATQLGLYNLAYQGVLLPLQQVARPIANVGFPTFASIQDDLPRCRHAYLSALRVSLLLAAPLPLLALFLASAGIPLLLGESWAPAVLPLQILSLVALIQIGMSLSPPLFNGLGRADLSLKWTLVALAANTVGIVAGLPWGINGVALGYLAAVAVSSPVQLIMVMNLIDLPFSELGRLFARMLSILVATSVAPGLFLYLAPDMSEWLVLAIGGGLISAGYLLFSILWAGDAWALLRRSAASVAGG
jgi:PST family polysaccharide transporter